MAHDNHTHQESDAKAAFMGLIIGAIVIFLVVRGIVSLTNAKFESHKPAAEAQHK